jgi:hypothetical protein
MSGVFIYAQFAWYILDQYDLLQKKNTVSGLSGRDCRLVENDIHIRFMCRRHYPYITYKLEMHYQNHAAYEGSRYAASSITWNFCFYQQVAPTAHIRSDKRFQMIEKTE